MKPTPALPPPFAWIDIPPGTVTLKAGGYLTNETTFDVPAFAISKYPITHVQFATFIEAGGYTQRQWWTSDGWQEKEYAGWASPQHWKNSQFNQPDYPVVGVSWYEALAFCSWLNSVISDDGKGMARHAPTEITLPTEQQWQCAARGEDGRLYPWGSTWDATRCNNSVTAKAAGTTPVTQFQGRGDSFYGVVDMAGNVWEWCRTAYESETQSLDGTGFRSIRGGSWYISPTDDYRVDYRNGSDPASRFNDHGFRVAWSP